ncbi:MAG TPA: dihydroorotate dehydrogenase electron transfer subunit [Candidatus Altiarchaeales archaeon]|nr:dihydroorotate dehydrogenase electron transfer subunit [Candidatus Altiarchaeales archaeon]
MKPKHRPEIVKILEVREECENVKTFILDKRLKAKPGQFCMIWVPDIGEKPFGFSRLNGNVEIMIRKVGKFTEKFFSLRKGDVVGIRGPYGDGHFRLKGENLCVVGGGVGIAPLIPLIEIAKRDRSIILILGAKTESEHITIDRFKHRNIEIILTTDDGSCGEKGSPCDILPDLIEKEKFDQIYACGPEPMMKGILEISMSNKIPCQLSLERYIKCGIGICGQCSLDPSGLLVCKDGPVFDAKDLESTEFGNYKRDASGSKVVF